MVVHLQAQGLTVTEEELGPCPAGLQWASWKVKVQNISRMLSNMKSNNRTPLRFRSGGGEGGHSYQSHLNKNLDWSHNTNTL